MQMAHSAAASIFSFPCFFAVVFFSLSLSLSPPLLQYNYAHPGWCESAPELTPRMTAYVMNRKRGYVYV